VIPGNSSSQGKYVDPPTSVSASAGNAQATVSFTLPAYDGKGVATYVATSSPSSITGSGGTSPITITGLSNGTSYTFTVTTISGYGVSAVSSASSAVTPVAPTTTAAPPFFPPDFTTTTTTTANPCASVNCASYGSPPGGAWSPNTTPNIQPWSPHCENAGYGSETQCAAGGYSYWEAYTSSDGCCVFNLFIACYCNPL
jgi:hypothetical protein